MKEPGVLNVSTGCRWILDQSKTKQKSEVLVICNFLRRELTGPARVVVVFFPCGP